MGTGESPPETRGWLGVPDALWNTIIGAVVTIILSYMAQRNHTTTLAVGEKAEQAAVKAETAAAKAETTASDAKDVASDAKITLEATQAAIKKNTEAVEKVAEVKGQ